MYVIWQVLPWLEHIPSCTVLVAAYCHHLCMGQKLGWFENQVVIPTFRCAISTVSVTYVLSHELTTLPCWCLITLPFHTVVWWSHQSCLLIKLRYIILLNHALSPVFKFSHYTEKSFQHTAWHLAYPLEHDTGGLACWSGLDQQATDGSQQMHLVKVRLPLRSGNLTFTTCIWPCVKLDLAWVNGSATQRNKEIVNGNCCFCCLYSVAQTTPCFTDLS